MTRGLPERRQSHRLSPIKLGVLECSQAQETVAQSRRELVFGKIELISEHHFERLGQPSLDRQILASARGRSGPRQVFVFFTKCKPDADDLAASLSVTRQRLDLGSRDLLHGGKEGPLIKKEDGMLV